MSYPLNQPPSRCRNTTRLGLESLEARLLFAIDQATTSLESLLAPPDVSALASQPTPNNYRNAAPRVATPIFFSSGNQPILRSAALSVLGRDDTSESLLTYRWSVSSPTPNASAFFSVNQSNAAKNTTVTFSQAGTYDVRVTIMDRQGLATTSSLRIQVAPVLTSIRLNSTNTNLQAGQSFQYSAQALEQFQQVMKVQPTFTWTSSLGSISSSGLYRAPNAAANATISVRSGNLVATARAKVAASLVPLPTPTPTPSPTPTPTPTLQSANIAQLVSTYYADGSITRNEMISILRSAGQDGRVDASELSDFRLLANRASSYGIADYVRGLTSNLVFANPANRVYRGAVAGDLVAGSTATHLNNLIDKWFLGADAPTLTMPSLTYQYTTGQLFSGTPSSSQMKQGALGDCYFIATLGALADRVPNSVRNIFVDNGDGTFTVRFFGGQTGHAYNSDGSINTGFRNTAGVADYVTIDRRLPTYASGILAYSGSGTRANDPNASLWIALAEKAYAQWNETGKAGRDGTNRYAAIEGGWMGIVAAQVLGHNSTDYVLANTAKNTVVQSLTSGRAVTVGTKGTATAGGLVGGHAYVLTGYDTASDRFNLRNPWGSSHPTPLSWSQLQTNCDWLSVANASLSTPIRVQAIAAPAVRSALDHSPLLASSSIVVMAASPDNLLASNHPLRSPEDAALAAWTIADTEPSNVATQLDTENGSPTHPLEQSSAYDPVALLAELLDLLALDAAADAPLSPAHAA
jgi:hypothetical protein